MVQVLVWPSCQTHQCGTYLHKATHYSHLKTSVVVNIAYFLLEAMNGIYVFVTSLLDFFFKKKYVYECFICIMSVYHVYAILVYARRRC